MSYDLVIKNGWVVDGSGLPRYRADVGVKGGRIASIGRIRESAREVIDAEGQVVSPGFVDGHTHMDAQVFWDPLGTSSCWHGITSVVMGNCGFTLAPCAKADRNLVIRNLQRAEDISAEAMEAGIEWTWTTFAEFLDAVEALPKGINYSGYMGHSALRTYVMGERAFDQPATEDDLKAMEKELRSALTAGAMGFTTSRSTSHETPDRRPVASRVAAWDEVRRLVGDDGRDERGHLRDRGRERGPRTGQPRPQGLPAPPARAGGRERAPGHLRPLQPEGRAGHLAHLRRAARRDRRRRRPHVRPGAQPLALRDPLLQDPAAVRPPARVEGAAGAPARRAEAAAPRSGAAPPPGRGRARARQPQSPRDGGAAAHLRLDLRHGHGRGAAPLGGGDRARARGRPGRGHDRRRPREGPRPLLPPAHRQREPGPRARADQAPAHRRDLLGLGRPRLPAHGRLAPVASPQPLGAREAGADARAGGAHADVRHGDPVGPDGPGPRP